MLKIFKSFILLSLLIAVDLNATLLDSLLKRYKKESALSKKTKKDDAGLLYLYTRDDLDKMQAKNLMDILKTIPGINLYRTMDNFKFFSTASNKVISISGARIFINDHDMTSAYFGSGFLIWGDINLDYIDHIEIYKATSSIEFGDETAPFIVKLYTKKASREVGSKAKIMVDDRGSPIISFYNAKQVNDNLSYFIYGNYENINNKKYHKIYKSKRYDYSSDYNDYNLYTNFRYKNYFLELGSIERSLDGFMGVGPFQTPDKDKNRLDESQKYIHLVRKFNNGYRVQFSIDKIKYIKKSYDPNNIFFFTNTPGTFFITKDSKVTISDRSYSFILDKTTHFKRDKLFIGGFYKFKKFDVERYGGGILGNSIDKRYKNNLSYSSLYAENSYNFLSNLTFISSIKEDFYNYKKDIRSYNKPTYKIGLKYKDSKWLNEISYINSYIPVVMLWQYDLSNIDSKAKNLKAPDLKLYLLNIRRYFKNDYLELSIAKKSIKHPIKYQPPFGYKNLSKKFKYDLMELTYHYHINDSNKIYISFYDSNNHSKVLSPKYGAILRVFNSFKKFDIYNEFICKSSYQNIKSSYDWTSSIKYHINRDLSIGLRAENVLNKGLKQAYRGINYPIPLQDRKIWFSLEYLF